ncbi:MFS transporter [Sphingomonas abietis]|uniref:MFS transporter n=1 Tax=Sphingomonas abietis TaxID=3012344 RepID=A0ABY7NVP8_9SPHN|nr:MFS transporter [Sphingomonas abietis]WBO24652.1 MFS transporter [Sphingomonas abietis]
MGGFAIGTTEFATMSLLPFMAKGLGIDEPTAGHVVSAYALGVVVGAPLLAVLSARIRRGTLLIALMVLFAIGNALSALAPSYGWMLAFRFLSGLPHGAYFGIAALVAARLLGPARRTTAVGLVMLGLTIATILGVPAANELGQIIGWRWGFGVVAILALITVALVATLAPNDAPQEGASPLRELGALRRRQVWLTVGIGAIGFGGFFAVYAYLASTLVAVTGMAPKMTPIVFACFGVGMTLGTIIAPRLADRRLMPTVAGLLMLEAAALAVYPLAAHSAWTIMLDVALIGIGGSFGTALQTRLMDVAEDAQSLAAALNQSAFNVANAIGPWLGGLAISAGFGWASTGLVGAGLALAGLVVWCLAMLDARAPLREIPAA